MFTKRDCLVYSSLIFDVEYLQQKITDKQKLPLGFWINQIYADKVFHYFNQS